MVASAGASGLVLELRLNEDVTTIALLALLRRPLISTRPPDEADPDAIHQNLKLKQFQNKPSQRGKNYHHNNHHRSHTVPAPLCTLNDMSSTENLTGNSGDGEQNDSSNSLNSIKSVFSSLKRAATNDSKKSDASTTGSSASKYDPLSIPTDPLPDNRTEIEGLLNRQLSALDHLRRTVVARNQEIKDYCSRAAYYYNLRPRVAPSFLRQLDVEIHILRQQRNGLQALVDMRHNEIVRMAEHRKKLDADQGLDCNVYDMYLNFRRISEWEQLFSI